MKLKIGFFAVMMALSLLLDHSLFSLAAFLAALIHELGHLGMAMCCNIRFQECKIGLYGAGLTPEDGLYSYSKEILLCLAGPLTNFLCLGISAFILRAYSNEFLLNFSFASFSLGFLNLLPIQGFDGGRILQALMNIALPLKVSNQISYWISFGLVFLLWLFSIYLLLRAKTSLSLFIFTLSLFGKIFVTPEK